METDCFNGTLPELATVGANGKEIYFVDIMNNLSDQFMQKVLIMSAILFIYVLYNYYLISPIMIKNYVPGTIQYWIYDLSHIGALIFSLALLVFSIIEYYNWRI